MGKPNEDGNSCGGCFLIVVVFIVLVGVLVGVITGDYEKGSKAALVVARDTGAFVLTIIIFIAFLALISKF